MGTIRLLVFALSACLVGSLAYGGNPYSQIYTGHAEEFYALSFSPKSKYLVEVSEYSFSVFEAATGKKITKIAVPFRVTRSNAVAFAANEDHLLYVDNKEGNIVEYDLTTKSKVKTYKKDGEAFCVRDLGNTSFAVDQCGITADAQRNVFSVISKPEDSSRVYIDLVEIGTGKILKSLAYLAKDLGLGRSRIVDEFNISPDGQFLFLSYGTGSLIRWDTGELVLQNEYVDGFSQNGKYVFTSSNGGQTTYETDGLKPVELLPSDEFGWFFSIVENQKLALTSDGVSPNIWLWELENKTKKFSLQRIIEGDYPSAGPFEIWQDVIFGAMTTYDYKKGQYETRHGIWNLSNGKLEMELPRNILATSADGKFIASWTDKSTYTIWKKN